MNRTIIIGSRNNDTFYNNGFALCYGNVLLSALTFCNVGVLWPNGWVDQDATIGPGDIALDRDAGPLHRKGQSTPTFQPMSSVAKQPPIPATAELLFIEQIKNPVVKVKVNLPN